MMMIVTIIIIIMCVNVKVLTNATIFTLFHDEGRFRMRNSQRSSIFIWRFI